MELPKYWRYVVTFFGPLDESRSSILDELNTRELFLGNTTQHRVAAVKSGCNEGMNSRQESMHVKTVFDGGQISEMIVAGAN